MAAGLVTVLEDVGWADRGGMALAPISPERLLAWSKGVFDRLGAIDFQDVLNASRAYVAAISEFDGHAVEAPWVPELDDEDQEAANKAEEAMWDKMMGV